METADYNTVMSVRNIDHDAVKAALIADGWTITNDPLRMQIGIRNMFVDLGLEREVIAAERGREKIAVEIQSFTGKSPLNDLYHALGQYLVYRSALKENKVDRRLYLAISYDSYDWIWRERIGEIVRLDYQVRLIVYDSSPDGGLQWIEPLSTAKS